MWHSQHGTCLVLTLLLLPTSAIAAAPDASTRRAIIQDAANGKEKFWNQIAEEEPYPTMGIRNVFSCARAFCEARVHAERLGRLFEIATRAQNRTEGTPGYGNFRWTWRDESVTDRNAVEFCMQDAILIWKDHRQWLPPSARESLRTLLEYSIDGCLQHRVKTSYTNIAIFNAGNLIALGEMLGRPDVAAEGYRRLDNVCLWTWQYGTHEYCSPTYYGTDLDGLHFIDQTAERESGRRQARAMLELFWTDIALNWFPGCERLAGPHSRSYDYLRGLGPLDRYPWSAGWITGPRPSSSTLLQPLSAKWTPPTRLRAMSTGEFPRLVRQRWGSGSGESRTHLLCEDITLGCSGATYGKQDMPMTIDLPGTRESVRCYFIADGREDPYGKKKYETSTARHMKALHLMPFWAGAQRGPDALGLVVYRPGDLDPSLHTNLQSHFVLRRDVDAFYLAGEPLAIPRGTPDNPTRIELKSGDPVVFRHGSAAVGMRVVWSRTQAGEPGRVALVDDGNEFGALRLTVDHFAGDATVEAGAAFHVRIGTGLKTDEAFDGWRTQFETAAQAQVEVTDAAIDIQVQGEQGPVALMASAPLGLGGATRFVPQPTDNILELDGRPIGRALLNDLGSIRAYRKMVQSTKPVDVSDSGSVHWEAEAGVIHPGMVCQADQEASGGHFAWHPDGGMWSVGSGTITWQLNLTQAGRYLLWGRVKAPTPQNDSFHVQYAVNGRTGGEYSWHTGHGPDWRWVPVCFEKSKTPATFDLPAGTAQLQLRVRETGTRIDQLFLTTDPADHPANVQEPRRKPEALARRRLGGRGRTANTGRDQPAASTEGVMSTEDLLKLAPDGVTVVPDIAYREGNEAWRLDLAMPNERGDAPRPAILYLHGGGWTKGDKRGQGIGSVLDYATKGFVSLSVNYRLDVDKTACIEDVKCAVRWLRAHAEKYNVDPNRIGAAGNSAGSHLALMLAVCPASAGLEGDGPYQKYSSLVQAAHCASTPIMPGFGRGKGAGQDVRKIQPMTYIRADVPPLYFIHGTLDDKAPVSYLDQFVKGLREPGAKDITYKRHDGTGHGAYVQHIEEARPAREAFLVRTLGKEKP